VVAASEGGDEERAYRDHGNGGQDGEPTTARLLLFSTVPKGRWPCTP
jgi:hypothetical protein